jgi:peptidylprolyl isomerase
VRRLLAVALATTFLLAGCSGDAEPEATPTPSDTATTEPSTDGEAAPTAEDVAALESVEVDGPLGATPTLEFDKPFSVGATVARVETDGEGAPLASGELLTVDYAIVDGSTGESLGSTWDIGTPQAFLLGDPTLPAALNDVLDGQNVGVRFLLAVPGEPTNLFVFEVVDSAPGRATGTDVAPAEGLPTVSLAENGAPSIEVGDAAEPTELVAQTLIEGAGDAVENGDLITVQYTGWLWDGTTFDSSWARGTLLQTTIGVGQVIAGWDQGLVGKTVGSQVLLLIPAELGYGENGQGQIPPGASLIFVVDILATS